MSKYDDLCAAYASSRRAYLDYRDGCFAFAQAVVEALVRYLEVPDGRVRLVPVNREPDPEALYSLAGAMHLDEDTYWHLGIVVELGDPAGVLPPQTVLIRVLLKRHDEGFSLRLGQEEEDLTVRDGFPQDMASVTEHIFETIKNSYEQGLQQFLGQQESTRKIGFSS